ncbi:NucA/NucB deoxyribonuclease domain-containing protein [Streptomyces sp. NPDC026672]
MALCGALLLTGTAPAGASQPAAGAASRMVLRTYTISDPKLVDDPKRVADTLWRDGSLDRLGVASAKAASQVQVDAEAQTDAAQGAEYTTDSDRYPHGRIPHDQYNYITTSQECADHVAQSGQKAGWIKNRFAYCQRHLATAVAYDCVNGPCKVVGTFVSQNTIFGYGKRGGPSFPPNDRWAEFWLHVDSIDARGVFTEPGVRMRASLWCGGKYIGRRPTDPGGIPFPDDVACQSTDSRTASLVGWRQNNAARMRVYSEANIPDRVNGEQLAVAVFQPRYSWQVPGSPQLQEGRGEDGGLRFDSAWYLQTGKQGSVFDRSRPGLIYRLGDKTDPARDYRGVAEVAEHIDSARTHPETTLPFAANKHLPGATRDDPLYRLAKAKGNYYRARYNANRSIVRSYCTSGAVPDFPKPGRECDEYPFASTYEGAAQYLEDNQPEYKNFYSVKSVSREDNNEAGARLGRWYDQNRILDHDRFFVRIDP